MYEKRPSHTRHDSTRRDRIIFHDNRRGIPARGIDDSQLDGVEMRRSRISRKPPYKVMAWCAARFAKRPFAGRAFFIFLATRNQTARPDTRMELSPHAPGWPTLLTKEI